MSSACLPLGLIGRTHLALNAFPALLAPPARNRAPAAPEGYRPICASIALAATALPSTPPVLPVPATRPAALGPAITGIRHFPEICPSLPSPRAANYLKWLHCRLRYPHGRERKTLLSRHDRQAIHRQWGPPMTPAWFAVPHGFALRSSSSPLRPFRHAKRELIRTFGRRSGASSIYTPDGSVTAVRHAWTFDDMFSAFATVGIKAKIKGQSAATNCNRWPRSTSIRSRAFAYFTYATVDGVKDKNPFNDVLDYWLEYDPKASVLTLHFTLPFKKPVKAKVLKIQIYNPEFFIDFAFAKKNPVSLVGAPALCAAWTEKPDDPHFLSAQSSQQVFCRLRSLCRNGCAIREQYPVQCP